MLPSTCGSLEVSDNLFMSSFWKRLYMHQPLQNYFAFWLTKFMLYGLLRSVVVVYVICFCNFSISYIQVKHLRIKYPCPQSSGIYLWHKPERERERERERLNKRCGKFLYHSETTYALTYVHNDVQHEFPVQTSIT